MYLIINKLFLRKVISNLINLKKINYDCNNGYFCCSFFYYENVFTSCEIYLHIVHSVIKDQFSSL